MMGAEMLLDHSEAAHRLAILHEDYMFEFDGNLLEGAERVYVVVWRFQMEAYNGGIWQFFSNSSGAFAPYLCESLTEIGAPQVADIAERAIAAQLHLHRVARRRCGGVRHLVLASRKRRQFTHRRWTVDPERLARVV